MTTLITNIGSVPTERRTPLWKRVVSRLMALNLLVRERTYMERLDEHLLRDMGLSRADIDGALSRPEDHLRSILLRGSH